MSGIPDDKHKSMWEEFVLEPYEMRCISESNKEIFDVLLYADCSRRLKSRGSDGVWQARRRVSFLVEPKILTRSQNWEPGTQGAALRQSSPSDKRKGSLYACGFTYGHF